MEECGTAYIALDMTSDFDMKIAIARQILPLEEPATDMCSWQ
jgi:hypothetical protein